MALRKKKSLLDQASDYVEAVRPQVESAVSTAIDAVEDFYKDTALPALVDAKDKAVPALVDAKDKATPYVVEARDRAATALADAREQAGPALADARAKAAPLLSDARDRATTAAVSAKEAADAKIAHLRGEEPEPVKKGGKLKKLALFLALAGVVGFAAKKLQGGKQADNWQSSYVPTPAPAPKATDAGAAAPGEAAADAVETPKPVTTPDDPAEVVDVDATDEGPTTK